MGEAIGVTSSAAIGIISGTAVGVASEIGKAASGGVGAITKERVEVVGTAYWGIDIIGS